MVRGSNLRLLYRVIFFCFCFSFACFYHHGSGDDKQGDKPESIKLHDEFKGKHLNEDVFLKQDKSVPNLAEKAERDDAWRKAKLSRINKKETVMKTRQSDRLPKMPKLSSSTPSPPELKVPGNESIATSRISHTNSCNNGASNIASSKNPILHQKGPANKKSLISLTTRNLRGKRDIRVSATECDNFTFTIKYENEYRVWTDFNVTYQGRYYDYKDYRLTNSGLQVCNSSEPSIKQRWRDLIAKEKEVIASQHCNASVDAVFTTSSYILYKNFTVFFELTQQYFTRKDYGVILNGFAICSGKLALSCNDDLVKIEYSKRFIVLQNFSLFYNSKMYDYREYRLRNGSVEICASNDPRILTIWKTRNSWEKFKEMYKCHVSHNNYNLNPLFYAVNNQFTVYLADNGQYLTRNQYAVINGKPHTCAENLRRKSTDFTKEDLLMCNNSIINIKYDEEYKVWKNFSIFYKNKVYDYTEYRALNDGIKICNSTDASIRNFWKLRNKWVKEKIHLKSCQKPIRLHTLYPWGYIVLKDFRVSILNTRQVIRRYDYGVSGSVLTICLEKLNKKDEDLIDKIFFACAFLLSCVCLFLLFVVYGLLRELRTLPGLNLMSLSFSFLSWQTYAIVAYSLAAHKVKMNSFLCAWKDITSSFTQFCTLTNSAVIVYLLSKTFCSNSFARSHEKKWKTFLRYSFFSWGIPVIVMIVNFVLVKVDVVRYSVDVYGDCVEEQIVPLAQCYNFLFLFLFLYTIGIFFISAYRLRQKLKDGNSIAQASNNAGSRNSLIVFVKLFSTTAITFWLPRKISQYVEVDDHVNTALTTLSFLMGLYIGVAFVFTKKNYKLLKKKYLPAKNKPSNENVTVRTSIGGILEERE